MSSHCVFLLFYVSSCFTGFFLFFFFNDTATTEIYTLSLHDALPILNGYHGHVQPERLPVVAVERDVHAPLRSGIKRSEEHTSELQSRLHLVCRLLLEKKKQKRTSQQLLYHAYTSIIYLS